MLGLFNGQGLEKYEIMVRETPKSDENQGEFVKLIIADNRLVKCHADAVRMISNRVQGAVLIGETDLEETFENLILNGLSILRYHDPVSIDPKQARTSLGSGSIFSRLS